jgi:hypothetical protein
MFHHLAVALLGGALTIGLGWSRLGVGVLVLAPLVASLGALAVAVLIDRRASPAGARASRIRDLRAVRLGVVDADRRADPAALCRRRV